MCPPRSSLNAHNHHNNINHHTFKYIKMCWPLIHAISKWNGHWAARTAHSALLTRTFIIKLSRLPYIIPIIIEFIYYSLLSSILWCVWCINRWCGFGFGFGFRFGCGAMLQNTNRNSLCSTDYKSKTKSQQQQQQRWRRRQLMLFLLCSDFPCTVHKHTRYTNRNAIRELRIMAHIKSLTLLLFTVQRI